MGERGLAQGLGTRRGDHPPLPSKPAFARRRQGATPESRRGRRRSPATGATTFRASHPAARALRAAASPASVEPPAASTASRAQLKVWPWRPHAAHTAHPSRVRVPASGANDWTRPTTPGPPGPTTREQWHDRPSSPARPGRPRTGAPTRSPSRPSRPGRRPVGRGEQDASPRVAGNVQDDPQPLASTRAPVPLRASHACNTTALRRLGPPPWSRCEPNPRRWWRSRGCGVVHDCTPAQEPPGPPRTPPRSSPSSHPFSP